MQEVHLQLQWSCCFHASMMFASVVSGNPSEINRGKSEYINVDTNVDIDSDMRIDI